jgi:RNase H-fold protein (predicted Holliday junction resolvase)
MVTQCVREFVRNAFGRQGGRELLALDIGTSRTGVAISRGQKMARPMGIISHGKGQSVANSMLFLSELVLTHDVAGVVVGWPLEDFHVEGKQCRYVMSQIRLLSEGKSACFHRMPILLRDESFSTRNVEETGILMIQGNAKRSGVVDELVAANLLQDVLDEIACVISGTVRVQ